MPDALSPEASALADATRSVRGTEPTANGTTARPLDYPDRYPRLPRHDQLRYAANRHNPQVGIIALIRGPG